MNMVSNYFYEFINYALNSFTRTPDFFFILDMVPKPSVLVLGEDNLCEGSPQLVIPLRNNQLVELVKSKFKHELMI